MSHEGAADTAPMARVAPRPVLAFALGKRRHAGVPAALAVLVAAGVSTGRVAAIAFGSEQHSESECRLPTTAAGPRGAMPDEPIHYSIGRVVSSLN